MRIPCEMIQDLIPSYVEEICSNTSKECVEEHIAECKECKELVQLYTQKDFSANSLEKKQLDGLKKLKKKVTLQNLFSYGLVVMLISFAIYHFEVNYNGMSTSVYYILFVICMTATYIVTMNQERREYISKKEKKFLIISLLSIAYEVVMYYYITTAVSYGFVPFGLEVQKVGPWLYGQERILFLLQIGLFGYSFYEFVKKNTVFNVLLSSNLMGIFLIFVHTSLLGNLSDITVWSYSFFKVTGVIIGIGMVALLLQYVTRKLLFTL